MIDKTKLIPIERFDLGSGRWYSPLDSWLEENEISPKPYHRSSTTICDIIDKGEGFIRAAVKYPTLEDARAAWGIRANIGTIVHELAEAMDWGVEIKFSDEKEQPWFEWLDDESLDWIRDQPFKYIKEIQKYMTHYEIILNTIQPAVEATEVALFDLELDWAGTADKIWMIKDDDGWKRWLIDLKTGEAYNTHSYQLISYKILWDHIFPDHKIDKIGGLYVKSGWRLMPKEKSCKIKEYNFDEEKWNAVRVLDRDNNKQTPYFGIELPTSMKVELPTIEEINGNKENVH